MVELPIPPQINIKTLKSEEFGGNGFLHIIRKQVTLEYPDNQKKDATIDICGRKQLDAVAILAHFSKDGEPHVYLRSSIRPALTFREYEDTQRPEQFASGNMWEIPAGLIETTETGVDGVIHAAQRELQEELGFNVETKDFFSLGFPIFGAVGLAGERIYFVEVKVDPSKRAEPTLDGSPFEYGGEVISIPLNLALYAVENGHLPDSKTEIGLLRLARFYSIF